MKNLFPKWGPMVREVHALLQPDGLIGLELGPPNEEGARSIRAEASPIEDIMTLAPDNTHVTMGVTVTMKESRAGLSPAAGIERTTGFYEPSAEQQAVIGGRRLANISPVSAPPGIPARNWRGYREWGGLVVEPEQESRELQLVTWSTGSAVRGSNVSHAEEQFAEWFTDRLNATWRRRVEHVAITLTHSPCGNCTPSLVRVMRMLSVSSPGATGSIALGRAAPRSGGYHAERRGCPKRGGLDRHRRGARAARARCTDTQATRRSIA